MPRQKNTRPTNIYWLYDTRPETVAVFGPCGRPFYCGKTVHDVEVRLRGHKLTTKTHPRRPLSKRLVEIGKHNVQARIVEVVPIDVDWAARERHWIKELRLQFPGAVNAVDGGRGCAGWVPTERTRKRMRAAQTGKRSSAETCSKISAFHKGKPKSAEHVAKMRESRLGKKRSPETLAKIKATKAWWATLRAKLEAVRASHA